MEATRVVDSSEGRDLATRFAMDFIETSAKDGTNVGREF